MKIALMMFLSMVATTAFAGGVSSTISAYNLNKVRPQTIFTITSTSSESLKDFLLNNVRPALRSFTDKTLFEGCGEVAFNASTKQYSVMLFSNKSHLACVIDPNAVAPGFKSMNVTIHSHGGNGQFAMNRADRVFTGMVNDPRSLMMGGENLEHFSPTDFQGGAGFLATPTTVRFQNGADTECDIKVAACAANF